MNSTRQRDTRLERARQRQRLMVAAGLLAIGFPAFALAIEWALGVY